MLPFVEFLLNPHNSVFFVAGGVLVAFFIVEIITMMVSASLSHFIDAHFDFHMDHHAEFDLLGWMGFGKVPLSIIMIQMLGYFSLLGFMLQGANFLLTGIMLSSWLIAPVALLISCVVLRYTNKIIMHLVPNENTNAILLSSLVNSIGVITIGAATPDSPAEIRVRDKHGVNHYVSGVPKFEEIINSGTTVLLLEQISDNLFAVQTTHRNDI